MQYKRLTVADESVQRLTVLWLEQRNRCVANPPGDVQTRKPTQISALSVDPGRILRTHCRSVKDNLRGQQTAETWKPNVGG
jgi:hypothetical protein